MNRNPIQLLYNPRPTFNAPPRTTFPNRTLIKPKEVDTSVIQQLFTTVMLGNITEIKKLIKQYGLTTVDMVDENGQNILHIILENDNLSKADKTECIKFLNKHSGLKMSYNANANYVTPLHLACKYQLYDIVKILINAGHDINAEDANGKTPLYYALATTDVPCPPRKKSKVKKTKVEKKTILSLSENLKTIIDNDNDLKRILTHIKNTCSILPTIFKNETMNIINSQKSKIIDIINDSSSSQDVKNSKLKNITSDIKIDMIKTFQEKVKVSLNQMKFETTPTGWGPDDNPKHKILKVKDPNIFYNDFTQQIASRRQPLINKLEEHVEVSTKLNSITNMCKNIDNVISYIHLYTNLIYYTKENSDRLAKDLYSSDINLYSEIFTRLNFNDVIKYKYNLPKYTESPIFTERLLHSDTVYDISNNTENGVAGFNNNKYTFTTPGFIKLKTIDPRSLENVKKIYNLINTEAEQYTLSGYDTSISRSNIMDLLNNLPYQDTFTRKLKIITQFMNNIISLSNTNYEQIIYQLNLDINNINVNDIYNNCINIQYNLLCLMNYLDLLNRELNVIKTRFPELLGILDKIIAYIESIDLKITLPTGEQKTIVTIYKYIREIINETNLIKEVENKSRVTELFSLLKTNYDNLNDIVNYINYIVGIKNIILYYNNFTDYNTFFTNNNTEIITNIYDKILMPFNKINDYKEINVNSDIRENKRIIIQTFLQQINNQNYFNLIDRTITVTSLPKIGYLFPINRLFNNGAKFNSVLGKTPDISFGLKSLNTSELNDSSDNLQGSIGKRISSVKDKTASITPSIGNELNNHFNILKYYFIRKLISKIYDELIKPTPTDNYKPIIDILQETSKNLNDTLNIDTTDKSLILQLLASNIDNLFIANLKSFIISSLNAYNYKDTADTSIQAILNKFKTDIPVADLELVNIDTTADKIVKYTKNYINDLLKTGNYDSYSYTYEEDIFSKPEKKVYMRYFENIINNDKNSCYKIDIDLIDLLIKNKADLNKKDKDGSTIIFSAIDSNNFELFNLLKDKVAVYNKFSKNLNGITPYNYALKHISYYAEIFTNKTLITDIIDNVNNRIAKKTDNDVIFRYQTQIYEMLFVLLNHYFYMASLQYTNGYTFEENNKLFKLIGADSKIIFPVIDSLITTNTELDKYKFMFDITHKEVEKEKEKEKDLVIKKDSIENLDKELNDISGNIEANYREVIIKASKLKTKQLITDIEKENNIDKLEDIKKNIADINYTDYSSIIRNKDKFNKSSNMISMYESLIKDVINADILETDVINMDRKTYMNVWKTFNNNEKIMIIEKVSKYILDLNKDKPDKILLDNLQVINSLFRKVINKQCKDYLDLEYIYNGDNYVLNDMVDIMKHIIKNTMMVNLYNMIQQIIKRKLLTKYPYSADKYKNESEYNKAVDDKLINILKSSSISKDNIHEFIFTTFTENLIKVTLELYEEDNTTIILSEQFDYIIKLIESNPLVVELNIKADFINVTKYFSEYLTENCKQMKNIIDGFINCLLNLSESLNIMVSCVEKANKEIIAKQNA